MAAAGTSGSGSGAADPEAAPARAPRTGRFQLAPQGAAAEPAAAAEHVSVLSWNILAQCFLQPARYSYVDPEALAWPGRLELIMEDLREAEADVVLLQEVMFTAYEEDIEPLMASLGYVGVMQNCRKRAEEVQQGLATFFREERFDQVWAEHRSRALILGLREKRTGAELAVANMHLEGNPHKHMARVSQARSALHQAAKHGRQYRLILCGDFNASLASSAVASYLSFGFVVPDVVEFSRRVKVPEQQESTGHEYSLRSAYPPTAGEFSFTTRGACAFYGMLDQMWFDTIGLESLATRSTVRSEEHLREVLARGLPSRTDPSDHLPVGAIFAIRAFPKDFVAAPAGGRGGAEPSADDVAAEMDELWENSTLSAEERATWSTLGDAVVAATPAPGRKPAPEELQALQTAKAARDAFVAGLEDGRREELQRLIELQKKEQKLRQKSLKQQSQVVQQQRKEAHKAVHNGGVNASHCPERAA